MKKSLVISTIATVLVVVVALTTATFAWFSTSQDSKVSGDFQISSAGGAFRLFPFDVTNATTGAGTFSLNAVSDFDLVEAVGTRTYNAAAMGAAVELEEGELSTFNPSMPLDVLTWANNEGTTLPSTNFVAANTVDTGGISVTDIDCKPLVVRFQLDTTVTEGAEMLITMKVSSAQATDASLQTARSVRFVLFGLPDTGDTSDAFVFGTDYQYMPPDTAEQAYPTPTYNSVAIADEYATGGGHVFNNGTAVIKGIASDDMKGIASTDMTNGKNFTTDPISMVYGDVVYCTLFLWFDGATMGDRAGDGQVSIEISFKQQQAQG